MAVELPASHCRRQHQVLQHAEPLVLCRILARAAALSPLLLMKRVIGMSCLLARVATLDASARCSWWLGPVVCRQEANRYTYCDVPQERLMTESVETAWAQVGVAGSAAPFEGHPGPSVE